MLRVLTLRAVCLVQGLEADDIAKKIDRSAAYVRGVWSGALRPSPAFKKAVSEALDLPEEALFRELTLKQLVS